MPRRTIAIGIRIGRGANASERDNHFTEFDTKIEWHARPAGNTDYATLCGIDGFDPELGQHGTVEPKVGQKIECEQCKAIWRGVMELKLRATDFK